MLGTYLSIWIYTVLWVSGQPLTNWQGSSGKAAFSRSDKGFIAIARNQMQGYYDTDMPDGYYCDIASHDFFDGQCTGEICINILHSETRLTAMDYRRLHTSKQQSSINQCGEQPCFCNSCQCWVRLWGKRLYNSASYRWASNHWALKWR